ncbi:MAG: glycine cleavage system aminomethyltransferase GcvT [Candidatus Gastranaerophilales bacterium]|nr:glycine cleavage system aminomethyltransferase GcvT [Candidatus Gastranaerophilales bacterium]
MARTYLYNNHIKLGAKMVDFAGWEMPVQYTGIIEEHNNVRINAGLFDVSHMGEIFVSGEDSLNYLQSLVPQDISKLENQKALYCQFTNEKGGIIDDLLIYNLKNNKYLLVVNASRLNADYDWLKKHESGYNILVENKSDIYSMVALQGPKSPDILEKAGIKKEEQPKTFHITETELLNEKIFISRTGYTGEDGFEIIIKNEKVSELWELLLECGKEFKILPIGLGARDTLRLEAAMSLYGNELNEETTPVEAGLNWTLDKDKKENYTGKETILNQLANGVTKHLIAFKMTDRAIARHEYPIYSNKKQIGYVTSGCVAPSLKENIGLGYISDLNLKKNDIIQVMIRNKLYNAVITDKNFIRKHNKGN